MSGAEILRFAWAPAPDGANADPWHAMPRNLHVAALPLGRQPSGAPGAALPTPRQGLNFSKVTLTT
jgi:hypothetical protein